MSHRILYAAGNGDVIQAHQFWVAGKQDPSQLSITFSSQFEEFCRDIGAKAYIVSYNDQRQILYDGPFTLEHRPKLLPGATGLSYHVREILYALSLFRTAIRFRADWAIIDSGTTHFFALTLFRLAGIRVLPVLHNSLWPSGFPSKRLPQRLIRALDSYFFRWSVTAIIGVSPECLRQVEQLIGRRPKVAHQMRAQYCQEYFATIPAPPSLNESPFHILFLGRIDINKGALDLLEMASRIEARVPGRVHWHICGSGPAFPELQRKRREMGLDAIISTHGWTPPDVQHSLRALSHLVIVPTRSSFAEGMALTAVEGILSGRPVLTSRVAPALEVLRPACIEVRPDDIADYVEAILRLLDDPSWYRALCKACPALGGQFYDKTQGKRAVLAQVFKKFG